MADNVLMNGLTAEEKKNLFGDAYLHMLWSCPSDPRFCYWAYVPAAYQNEKDPHYQLMVIVHGTGCATENYINYAMKWADKNHVAILAPMFPSGLVGHDNFNSYKLVSDAGIRYDQILLSEVEDMKVRYPGVKTDKFFLFGHSGGGQFSERFTLVHPERVKAVNIGAPGRPTFINYDEDYFWGIRDFKKQFDKEFDIAAFREVPVIIVIGEKDTKFIGESPYGISRMERMHSLQKNFLDNGVKSVELEVIPGIAHEDGDKERIETATRFFTRFL